jgi:hypothetical protein
MASRGVAWVAMLCGALVLPHYTVIQLAVGGVLIYWGTKELWGGFPIPLAIHEVFNGQRKERTQDERSGKEE